MWPHEKLIDTNGIAESQLPTPIQTMIKKFEALNRDLVEAENDDDEREEVKISRQLKSLSKDIAGLIKDHLDDESEDDLSPDELRLAILDEMVSEGKTQTTSKELANKGYPGASRWGMTIDQRVGNKYRLVKRINQPLHIIPL